MDLSRKWRTENEEEQILKINEQNEDDSGLALTWHCDILGVALIGFVQIDKGEDWMEGIKGGGDKKRDKGRRDPWP
jgi:hypothetical protein